MKIYDITNEMFTAKVFPGDPAPSFTPVQRIEDGAVCNLTTLSLGTHNGSHLDAPSHFYADGRTIDKVELEKCVGYCTMVEHNGTLTRLEVETISAFSRKKLLIKGRVKITEDAAEALVKYGFEFIGVESLTIGPEDAPMAVHLTLLHPDAEIVIAENLNLRDVPVGEYFLAALPMKLGGMDGSPCRAVLIK